MERIVIHKSKNTPDVLFDGNSGILNLSGISIPEEPKELYQEILYGLDEYAKDPQELLVMTVDLEFFNTATARELLKIFKKIIKLGIEAHVIWVYEEGDEDMEEAGMDYNDMMKDLTFEFVEKPEQN